MTLTFLKQLNIIVLLLVVIILSTSVDDAFGGWMEWIEDDAPFVSCVVDAREGAISNNLTPRALVLPLGQGVMLAYDVDLLRVAAVWVHQGEPFVNKSMAVNSYPYAGKKVGAGQRRLPRPSGVYWIENGIYPGITLGKADFNDPRQSQPDPEEVGRGGLSPSRGQFLGVNLTGDTTLDLILGDHTKVTQQFSLGDNELLHAVSVSPRSRPIEIVLTLAKNASKFSCTKSGEIVVRDGHVICRIAPSLNHETVLIRMAQEGLTVEKRLPAKKRWPHPVTLNIPDSPSQGAMSFQDVPLPKENPCGRAVRPSGLSFFSDGRLALLTFDGDVWIGNGLQPKSTEVEWRRYASGLHEPMGLAIRRGSLFVFDRNGVWKLHDKDGNGEADYHELFCSQIDQTADTREYAMALELMKDDSFLVCKPGQNSKGRGSGSVLHISADGKKVTEFARGLRQPYMGYDLVSGQIALSDQQGHHVPSTPVMILKKGAYYGFPNRKGDDLLTITPPLTWIPHQVCSSSTSPLWMRQTKMGALNDQLVVLAYHPPRLLQVHVDPGKTIPQGGATVLPVSLETPSLKGAINPADGLLYVAGFKIWGSQAKEAAQLGRIRVNHKAVWPVPVTAVVEKRGVLLSFADTLKRDIPSSSIAVRRWNYLRSPKYGSPNLKRDGTAGTEPLPVSSVKLSKDQRSLFIGLPDMRKVMQLELTYTLPTADGEMIQNSTYLTVHRLPSFSLIDKGFSDDEVDMTIVETVAAAKTPDQPTKEKGALLYTQLGCMACHSVDGSMDGKSGPSWLNLYGRERLIIGSGEKLNADEAYLRESILQPAAKVAEGAVTGEAGMPIYEGVLNNEQIESLILYIKSLKK